MSLDNPEIERFHELYYASSRTTWENTYWLGARALKCPLDLWIYQEILVDTKPDLIIESGTAEGGSALFLASVCDALGHGEIITIDSVDFNGKPVHPRIRYLVGSSTSPDIARFVTSEAARFGRVMVILDSDHSKDHVLDELTIYGDLVSIGNYLIVEDTNINGHPVLSGFGCGPMEAVHEFMRTTKDFVIDRSREKFYLTFNPKGYLKRISS
jgi:cephalosporin hydroxylase